MTTVTTAAEFVEQLANCTERLGFVDDACRWCRSRPSRGEPEHAPDCPVLRAQQVRDTARGAASGAEAAFQQEMVGRQYGEEETNDAWLWFKAGWERASATAPVSPGAGPPGVAALPLLLHACAAPRTALATRALRPAREVACEVADCPCRLGYQVHSKGSDLATAAIERDRAGGRR